MLAVQSITDEIQELKQSRRAVILAHHYQDPEIQELADAVGDSLELARAARDFEGGAIAFRTAAAVPDRIGAVGSFHGGGLVTKTPNSPHLQAAKSKAQFLIAIAANDDQRAPDDKNVLKETFEKANLPAEIEVYAGAAHGWCPPDSGVYNEPQAEKAWARLLVLYGKALA